MYANYNKYKLLVPNNLCGIMYVLYMKMLIYYYYDKKNKTKKGG